MLWDQTPASHPAHAGQSCWPHQTKHNERGDVFMNQFGTRWRFGRRDVSGSIQSSVSTWRRTISSYVSKDQAVFVPTLSCRHVRMDVCLSLASNAGLPDVEPTAMLQRACKL